MLRGKPGEVVATLGTRGVRLDGQLLSQPFDGGQGH
jgi:hypothetical protein